ncbi:MAG: hypothetical protein GXP62_14655, partial [Oligoflexia bacterium]|nr:hypothetical protein [Oligoflexia bacterium]
WDALATLGQSDPTTEATALRGKADALFADDRYADALPLYQEAADLAPDPADAGWAALGAANALAALGDPAAPAKLDALMDHPDPEVAVQAAVRRSQIAAEAEDWETARKVLADVDASSLGSAWDTTVSLTRAAALSGAGSYAAAADVIGALSARWPDDEEAQLPALLARADLARAQGDLATARGYARQAQERAQDPGFQQQAQALLDQLAKQ